MNSLDKLLKIEQKLAITKSAPIADELPLITRGSEQIIFPNTINIIKGSEGSHKSRLASMFVSCVLKKDSCQANILGLEKEKDDLAIIYVDTERNLKAQFPKALQQMQLLAGFEIHEVPDNFFFTSLLNINRNERMKVLGQYIESKRKQYPDKHFLIVLDVLTDCLSSFNDASESLSLVDNMNRIINKYECTILGLIHVNPGTNKARGHLGTEIANKASTVLRTKVVDDGGNKVIKIIYDKCRNTKCYDPIHTLYDADEGLKLITDEALLQKLISASRASKAPAEDIAEELSTLLDSPMERSALIDHLKNKFDLSKRSVEKRIKEIIDDDIPLYNGDEEEMKIAKGREGTKTFYSLVGVDEEE